MFNISYYNLYTKQFIHSKCFHYGYDDENRLFTEYDENYNLINVMCSDYFERTIYEI